tara:strand:+ start:321 stop:572 length:252 start_codon:yes stop_codon:yes gene_type:complete
MVSIADVKVSQDLRHADIYLSFYNKEDGYDPKVHFEELRKNISHIKYKLGIALKLKYMPRIKFFLSDDYGHYDKINRILKNDG